MATASCCRLNPQTGTLPEPKNLSQLYRVQTNTRLCLELEAASPLCDASTALNIDIQKYEGNADFVQI